MSQAQEQYETRIPIQSTTRDALRAEKVGSETYNDVIDRLLDREGGE